MAKTAYTDEQRAEALKLYVEHGPAEAARRTGIRRATISMWANRAGVTVTREAKTRAATEAARAAYAERRARMCDRMAEVWFDLMHRVDEPHQEFVGQQGKEVTYAKAPAGSVKAYVTAACHLLDKMRLEEGQATDRTEHMSTSDFDREVAELVEKVKHVDHADASVG